MNTDRLSVSCNVNNMPALQTILSIAMYKETTLILKMSTFKDDLLPVEINAYYINRGATFAAEYDTTNKGGSRLVMSFLTSEVVCHDRGEYTCFMRYASEGQVRSVSDFQNLSVTGKASLIIKNNRSQLTRDAFRILLLVIFYEKSFESRRVAKCKLHIA